jgi:DNA-binding MurR/RpiR family transcriptional regulator
MTVWRWQERFMLARIAGLLRDKTRPPRIPPLPMSMRERAVALALGDPPGEAAHWTAAMMAKTIGISVSSVQRVWRTHGRQPYRVRQFKLSHDPTLCPSRPIRASRSTTSPRQRYCRGSARVRPC